MRMVMLVLIAASVGCLRQTPTSSPTPAHSSATASAPTAAASRAVTLDLTKGLQKTDLMACVGLKVVLKGYWRGTGKPGAWLQGGQDPRDQTVYLAAGWRLLTSYRPIDGEVINVVGVLRYVPPPATARLADTRAPATQPVTPGFYVDVEDVRRAFTFYSY
jgi:hypothetical protein